MRKAPLIKMPFENELIKFEVFNTLRFYSETGRTVSPS